VSGDTWAVRGPEASLATIVNPAAPVGVRPAVLTVSILASGGGSVDQAERLANEFQKLVLDVIAEKTALDVSNEAARRSYTPGPNEMRAQLPGDLMQFELFQFRQSLVQKVMEPHRFYVWLDLVRNDASPDFEKKTAVYELELKKAATLFTPAQKEKLNSMMAVLKALQKDLPPEYPYLMTISELPALNASLNFISTVFLSLAWFFIRRGHWRRHMVFMIVALCSSTMTR
jgi:hypothetical protein